jgi:hypothetical protein
MKHILITLILGLSYVASVSVPAYIQLVNTMYQAEMISNFAKLKEASRVAPQLKL